MATQLFFRGNLSSDYGTGNNDAKLNGSASGWNGNTLSLTRGTSAGSFTVTTVAGPTNGIEVTPGGASVCVWYSPPLNAAVTISGSITWNLRASESSNSANSSINARIEKIDGATGAITLIDQTARTTELGTSEAAAAFSETPAAGVACKRGDRLRVRVFADDAATNMGAGFTVSFFLDGPTAAASGDSYLTLTENLTFASEPAGTQIFPTDTASAVSTGTLVSSFSGADENPLSEGGLWANLDTSKNPLKRAGNVATASVNSAQNASYYATDFGPELDAYVTLTTIPPGGNLVQLRARVQGAGGSATWDGYAVQYIGGGQVDIYVYTNAVAASSLGSALVDLADGDKLGIRCTGSSISAWTFSGGLWTRRVAVTNATYGSAGKVALYVDSTTSQVDDLYVAPVGFFNVNREAWTSRGAGVQTDVTNTVAGWTAPIQVTDTAGGTVVDWFTRPLTAFTLGGAVRCHIRGAESNAAANAAHRVEIAVVAGDGTGAVVWHPVEPVTLAASWNLAQQRLIARFLSPATTSPLPAANACASVSTSTMRPMPRWEPRRPSPWYYAGAAAATGDTYLTFTQTLTEFSSGPDVVPRGRIPQYAQHLAH